MEKSVKVTPTKRTKRKLSRCEKAAEKAHCYAMAFGSPMLLRRDAAKSLAATLASADEKTYEMVTVRLDVDPSDNIICFDDITAGYRITNDQKKALVIEVDANDKHNAAIRSASE